MRGGFFELNVTYSLSGGGGVAPTESSKAPGGAFTVAATPSRVGYNFTGWSDGTSIYQPGSVYTVGSSDVTLTAQWNAINYTITYSLGGASGTAPTESTKIIGQKFNLASTPSRTGYNFTGWSDSTNTYAAGAEYTVGSADVTLTAQWSPKIVTFSYNLNGGSW